MAADSNWPEIMDEAEQTIATLLPQLIEAALSDLKHPIDLLLRHHPPDSDDTDPGQHVQRLEELLSAALTPHGIRPCRRVRKLIPGFPTPVLMTVYFRPSEEILFQALGDQHPIVLATTLEPQRYIDDLLKRAKINGDESQIWIWRGASGSVVLEQISGKTDSADAPDAKPRKLEPPEFHVGHLSQIEQANPQVDLDEMLPLLLDRAFRDQPVSTCFDRDDHAVSFWYSIEGNELHIIIDDRAFHADETVAKDLNDAVMHMVFEAYLAKSLTPEPIDTSQTPTRPGPRFVKMLAQAVMLPDSALCIVPDAHHFLDVTDRQSSALQNISALKDTYHRLRGNSCGPKLLLLMGGVALPNDLREEVLRIELNLPGRRELSIEIGNWFREVLDPGEDDPKFDGDMMRLSEEAAGMTLAEVRAIIDRAGEGRTVQGCLDALRAAKRRHVARTEALEIVDTTAAVDLGGMDQFLQWLDVRSKVFKDPIRANAIGIHRTPRGILLLGLPGSGKSLAAKVIARRWKLPLVRLDVGALRDKWVGSSEARIREALQVVEAMAPCILWIDEIDKGVGQAENVSSSTADLNIRATLLTWMQEHRYPVFTVATANRFAHLPPELTRAGRFDARFFFGCPGDEGRRQIFTVHIEARGYTAEEFALDRLVAATLGFTGAEIEQTITDSLYAAFASDDQLSTDGLLEHVARTKPLIRTAGKALDEVWDLVELGRVDPASKDMLTRAQVAKLIDPYLYRPCYCRLEAIQGFEKQHVDAARILMSSPLGAPAAAVMNTGEAEWIYVETNFRANDGDLGMFKFIDAFENIERNFVFDTLLSDHGLDAIYFEDEALMKRFIASDMFSAYSEMFRVA